jgi:predicted NUDIX family NTP pyrophosphohydrolase
VESAFRLGDNAAMRMSAGLLLYRYRDRQLEVLIAHPGGPYFAGKDEGHWSIPKGEPATGEDLLEAARREFVEETGFAPAGPFLPLTSVTQKGGKRVHAWAVAGEWDPATLVCNTFRVEWPPGSGRVREFPEIDRAAWCSLDEARRRLKPAQTAWLDELPHVLEKDRG